ncbi:uncharacterized protein LOC119836470 isoform X2 [Zerene cesonia]|uniref:uncharacterized protein LOC119836470 isoform X2 n=1 Tax=Zerene cesonia TaxID=33412 RepID=UPI0018E51DC6|nr:uncharacterized protein LOC119836470 isoform X2 [Zerene cesonia]
MAEVTSSRSSPAPEACPECDTGASVTSDLHKYQVACTCKPAAQYACADDPGPPPPAKTDTPPALPPRPPTSVLATNRRHNAPVGCTDTPCRRKKYAWWCCGCGALAAALGGLLAAQHILLRAYTASPHHLETVPAAVPAAMLVLTGVCIMSLARRRNRYSYMIKVVGACCLVCALTCVLVTITTTVIHMNKLQTLKYCEYTRLTRTCSCFSISPEAQQAGIDDDGVRCVFEGVTDCAVVHGALYWCLRGVFALSVTAVLVCIFSCMLAYQLLSHERKKMYWEQLELRCRSLYRPPTGQPAATTGRPVQNNCSCCAQCHTTQPAWDFSLQHRFWAPGRIGNLYSPNPGSGRKTSPWSWFPWPRGNSQNSRCRMEGVPQSGDSAYGFCETEQAQGQQYPNFEQFRGQSGNFPQASGMQGLQGLEGFEGSSFDTQTGVWGPPPPYSPQGRSGSRHHLHQDPATTTLLHHHHIDVHRNPNTHEHNVQTHTCARNSYLHQDIVRLNPELVRMNPELIRVNPELLRANPELLHANPELLRTNPELLRTNPELLRANPELLRANPDLLRANPELLRANPELLRANPELLRANPELLHANPELLRLNPELMRLNPEFGHMSQEIHLYPQEMQEMGQERFSTLRGHLVPYRNCARLGLSVGNLHRDCGEETMECVHQKSGSKDQSADSCMKQGKENLAFQNDKQSPIRSSMQDCHRGGNPNTESEVYFADVSSCCNADCCMNPNVSALVGTIENHPESTSESDTGSFTLTRQQRPQPQVGSKRRPRQADKKTDKMRQDINNSIRLTEQQIEQLNNSMRMNERNDRMDRIERIDSRDRLNDSRIDGRLNDSRIDRSDGRLNDSRIDGRLNDSRIDRSDGRMNDSRIDRNDGRLNDSRIDRSDGRLNDSRIDRSDGRLNDSRIDRSDGRLNDSRFDRMNDCRHSRIDRISDMRDMNDSRLNDSCIDRMQEASRMERIERIDSRDRIGEMLNESRERARMSDRDRMSDRERMSDRDRMSDRFEDRRMSNLNSSLRIEGSPKMRPHISPLKMPKRNSPKNPPKDVRHEKEFLAPVTSPLSPNTDESLLSDDDARQEIVYSNDSEAKCLGPDSQYEPVRDNVKEEILKTNHHHCYSDTNTMDSGWQSGSERQVTD